MSLKRKVENFLKRTILKISPTFRLLSGNKERMNILLSKIETLETESKNSAEIYRKILLKMNNFEKTNNLSLHILGRDIGHINDILINNGHTNPKVGGGKRDFISIICLIYRSTSFARAVHDSLFKFTPKLNSGEAELIFVANDANDGVIDFLKKENFNFLINNNDVLSEDELFAMGYGAPEYINRVYRGYNFGIKNCKGNIVVLINSDNMFSPNWLENLLNKLDNNLIVCSQLVERNHPRFGVFPTAIPGEFGDHPNNFLEKEFLSFALSISKNKLVSGGAYMPCISYKENFERVNYYPEGNIAGKSFSEVIQYGDENFYEKLAKIGIMHATACDSIVYHFKEGERED